MLNDAEVGKLNTNVLKNTKAQQSNANLSNNTEAAQAQRQHVERHGGSASPIPTCRSTRRHSAGVDNNRCRYWGRATWLRSGFFLNSYFVFMYLRTNSMRLPLLGAIYLFITMYDSHKTREREILRLSCYLRYSLEGHPSEWIRYSAKYT